MEQSKIHRITVNIVGVDPFKLPVKENEESFYRSIIERINENCKNLIYGTSGDGPTVALAKVALYYAEIIFCRTFHPACAYRATGIGMCAFLFTFI